MLSEPAVILKRASGRLADTKDADRLALWYGLICIAVTAVSFAIEYTADTQVENYGGLSHMGIRSVLSSISMFVPVVRSLLLMCLNLGYCAAMLRVARGQYVSPKTLRAGWERFFPMLRMTLLEALLLIGLGAAASYAASAIYMISPLASGLVETLEPLLSGSASDVLTLDDASMSALNSAMLPLLVIWGVLFAAVSIPLLYSYRMANYILIEQGHRGGRFALRESRRLMKGSRLRLLKLDLRFWWYYLLNGLAVCLCFGDLFFSRAGIHFPWSDSVSAILFYLLYLLADLAVICFFRNRVGSAYACAYDDLCPKEKTDSVVLGNIFQM